MEERAARDRMGSGQGQQRERPGTAERAARDSGESSQGQRREQPGTA